MRAKVSIIIPNYNNARYLKACLESVIMQEYPDKEIIIVDDGSTDDSVMIMQNYTQSHKDNNIRLICQNHFNASIARNRGMEYATGDYALFLDSDDLLEDGVLGYLVDVCNRDGSDLVIGNYEEIDEKDKIIGKKKVVENDTALDAKKEFEQLVSIGPVPSNKLFNLKLIKENKLEWGNVRIGQDLNFFLKYLLLCNSVSCVNKNIYKYRIGGNSVSRTYDFRIFDIVNVFSDIEEFYNKNKSDRIYKKFIPIQALKHYYYQMSKQVYYDSRSTRKLIINYFRICEKNLDYTNCATSSGFKKLRIRFTVKSILWPFFVSRLYRAYILRKKRSNG